MKPYYKYISVFLATNILFQISFPTIAFALTGGPSQPEVQSFEPVGTTEMVDLFSGDFNYNIPLLDVEGYPINIAYHSGITMDQEASMVGLGWNINPGVINRTMRGLPDDFNGDMVKKDMFIKDNYTFGTNFGIAAELFGFGMLKANLSYTMGIYYNNYKGVGYENALTPAITAGNKFKFNASYAISSNSQTGMTVSPSLGISFSLMKHCDWYDKSGLGVSASVGTSYNSRSGLKTLTFSKGVSYDRQSAKKDAKGKLEFKDGPQVFKTQYNTLTSGSNGGSSVSFANQTYTPQLNMSMTGVNVSVRATFGGAITGIHPHLFIGGYFSSQGIDDDKTSIEKRSYGYLYSQESTGIDDEDDVLHDINREKDAGYSKNCPNLPITNYSYDLYAVSGQGIGGMYRPYRSDVGHVHDDKVRSVGYGGSVGAEFGVTLGTKWGADLNYNWSSSQSNRWVDDNNLLKSIGWSKKNLGRWAKNDAAIVIRTLKLIDWTNANVGASDYEPVYFKNVGEKTAIEESFVAYQKLERALRPAFETEPLFGHPLLKKLLPNIEAATLIPAGQSEVSPLSDKLSLGGPVNTIRTRRDKRNQNISYLTVKERSMCFNLNMGVNNDIPRNSDIRKDNHITEITAINDGGSRYIYGIAAYNNTQKEASFTMKDASTEALERDYRCSTGLATYPPAYTNVKKGETSYDGYDGYYSATTLPGYAYSYLLTTILSPDYVDINNNGADAEDLGHYTKINYKRVVDAYKWRSPSPSEQYKASYNEGLKTDLYDGKGTYIYGEKEIWYIESIESRNYIAKFNRTDRLDGLGVLGEAGGINGTTSQKLKSLESISLYAKADLVNPIKTVHFTYDYLLCKESPNSIGANQGKLTLTALHYTYGSSLKGMMNKYEFTYSANNPKYDIKAYDRWGNYKPNTGCYATSTTVPNSEYPYVEQNKTKADINAESWSLKSIKLPSGGQIDVDYESDDYAYVQNKKAMQMFKVAGFGTEGGAPQNKLYGSSSDHYDVIFIKLDPAKPCASAADFAANYLPEQTNAADGTRYLYFNLMVNITGTNSQFEYVRGYAQIADGPNNFGVNTAGDQAWIKVKKVAIDDDEDEEDIINVSPFVMAAWQFSKLHTPYLVYPGSDVKKSPNGDFLGPLRMLVGVFAELADYFKGFNRKLMEQGYAKPVDLDRCWVRLSNPDQKKLGGGLRVKNIAVSDNWNSMTTGLGGTAQASSTYEQQYEYTTVTKEGKVISSGVASYEPLIGNDENPWKQPVLFNKENALIPDETFYAEEPFGESFFPSPSIGYSKVTVKSKPQENVTTHATGWVENEFYTTKDFPTITDKTEIQKYIDEPDWITGLFCFKVKNYVATCQGFQIELNDMNGKPKSTMVYRQKMANEEPVLLSGIQYFYKTDTDKPWHLNNQVTVIAPDGSVRKSLVGIDADMIYDTRQEVSESQSAGLKGNLDMIYLPPFILFAVPAILPSYSADKTRFRSAVITRVINRYGILEKTVAFQDKATITTTNIAYDSETGEVLLTQTQNEYNNKDHQNDNIYNLMYPAHWAYDGMGMAYKNSGIEFDAILNSGGIITSPANFASYLSEGDEVVITNTKTNIARRGRVLYDATLNQLVIIDNVNNPFTYATSFINNETVKIKVLTSGRKNLQNAPIQSVTSQQLPFNSPTAPTQLSVVASKSVVNSTANAFSDIWNQECQIVNYQDQNVVCKHIDSQKIVDVVAAVNELLAHEVLDWSIDQHSFSAAVPIEDYEDLINLPYYNQTFIGQNRAAQGSPHTFKFRRTGNAFNYAGFGNPENLESMKYLALSALELGVSFPMSCEGPTGQTISGEASLSTGTFYIDLFPYTRQTFFQDKKFTEIKLLKIVDYFYHSNQAWCILQYDYVDKLNSNLTGNFKVYSQITIDVCSANTQSINLNGCIHEKDVLNSNPFFFKGKGIWRKKKDYLYLTNRVKGTTPNVRYDGFYSAYAPFWQYSSTDQKWLPVEQDWVWTNEVVNYNNKGLEIENRDKLNRFQSVLYNANRQPIAVANNAQQREIGYIGFEYATDVREGLCAGYHWNFQKSVSEIDLDNQVSHTGYKSLKLESGAQFVFNKYNVENCGIAVGSQECIPCPTCIPPFNPFSAKKYVVSGWVKVSTDVNSYNANIDDLKARISVSFDVGTGIALKPKGKIIDGWQKFEEVITIPTLATNMEVQLASSTLTNATTYYDDIRIFPVNGNMKTYVYHPTNNRLMAELDENNYATFFEYDNEGALIRVKKETEKGIATIKESRSHLKK